MTNTSKWSLAGVGLTTVLSTGLDGLASGSMSAASSAYSNDTNLDLYVDIEVSLASLSPAAGAYVSIFIAEAVDGSNFPAPSAADMRLSISQLLATIPIGVAAASAQRVVYRQAMIPPAKFNIYLDNQTGAALNATGNTVKFLPYDINLNA